MGSRPSTAKEQFHKPKSSSQQKTRTQTTPTGPKTAGSKPQVIEEVSRAKEVDEYLMNEVYFGQSNKPRDRKSTAVAFSVGQIVRHKTGNYVGVIVGWDEVAQASGGTRMGGEWGVN